MGSATATSPFVISLLIALVSLNLPSKFTAQYVHYPPALPKKHNKPEPPVPQPPVSEPVIPYFPFVYIPTPSPSVKPYEPTSPPPLPPPKKHDGHKQSQSPLSPLSPFAEPLVPYFPFVYIPIPSPSEKPYEDASTPPSPVSARPSRKRAYPPSPINHLPLGV